MDKSTRTLLAAIAGVALTSGAHAQALSDGVPSDASEFDTITNISTLVTPVANYGDDTGATLTQINLITDGKIDGSGLDYHYVELNIDGGITDTSEDYFNSEINLLSGQLFYHSNIHANSVLNVSGTGNLSLNWDLHGTANVNGGTIDYGKVKSGGTLNFNAGTAITTGSGGIDVDNGGTFNLSGGTIGSFVDLLLDSTFNMTGGSTGNNLDFGGVAHVSGGSIGNNALAKDGGVVNLTGGSIGGSFQALDGSVINISDGSIGASFKVQNGAVANISGGSIASNFRASSGSEVDITGGTIAGYFHNDGSDTDISGGTFGFFRNSSGSTVNFFGTEFFVDGVAVPLTLGDTFTITDRDVDLTGILADGSAIDFTLDSVDTVTNEWFASDSTVTLTLLGGSFPEGDINLDGSVNGQDLAILAANFGSIGQTLATGDISGDGDVNGQDLAILAANFGAGSGALAEGIATVPEPTSLALLGLGGLALLRRRR